jgi:hypothetical protein
MQKIIEKIDHIGFYVEGAVLATAEDNPAFDVLVKLLSKLSDFKDYVIDTFEDEECTCEPELFDESLPEFPSTKKKNKEKVE